MRRIVRPIYDVFEYCAQAAFLTAVVTHPDGGRSPQTSTEVFTGKLSILRMVRPM